MRRVEEYALGTNVICSSVFTDEDGADQDPSVVNFSFYHEDEAAPTVYVYGTDNELVKDSVGHYHVNVDGNAVGWWYYRFYSTGTGQAAEEHKFRIRESNFD